MHVANLLCIIRGSVLILIFLQKIEPVSSTIAFVFKEQNFTTFKDIGRAWNNKMIKQYLKPGIIRLQLFVRIDGNNDMKIHNSYLPLGVLKAVWISAYMSLIISIYDL